MFERIKFFPVMIAMLVAFLGLKGLDLWTGTSVNLQAIGTAQAAEKTHKEEPAKTQGSEAHHDEPKHDDHGEVSHDAPEEKEGYLSAADVDIRNSMEDRDAKLTAWEEELKIQQNMITVAERRVESKIAELKELEATLRRLMGEQTEKEEADLLRLVKVYETMKPKAAAPIMERLDSETRLSIAVRMKEVKLALILANMDEDAANELTRQIMRRAEMPEEFGLVPAGAASEETDNRPAKPEL